MKITVKTIVLATILMLITAIPTLAEQVVGGSPYTADLLTSGLNTGRLAPGQEYWYAYSRVDLGDPDYNSVIISLNFEAEGRAVASRVNFQLFNFAQVEEWLKDNSGPVDSLGLGMPASADFDVNTGERFWAGAVALKEVYYVRIFNLSPSPVQYRMTALGQKGNNFDTPAMAEKPATVSEAAVIPAAAVSPLSNSNFNIPVQIKEATSAPLATTKTVIALPDNSNPSSTSWLLAAEAINGLPPQEAAAWLMSAASLGWLIEKTPSVKANPNAIIPAIVPEKEGTSKPIIKLPPKPVALDASKGYNIYPNQPLKLIGGDNTGRLSPKAEHWYKFTPGSVDGTRFENMSLTMFFTPGEPNIGQNITFEMFTSSQYQIWERGSPDDMKHFGAGSLVSRDGNYSTGERLWHGVVVDGNPYYIKVSNSTDIRVDYHLITGDIINIEMGTPNSSNKQSKAKVRVVKGKDIGTPLTIRKGRYTGKLAAREDVWFTFENKISNPDTFDRRNYTIELKHRPGGGYVTNYVNVEIYPFQEQRIWQRGDTDKINPLGAGSDASYDKSTNTHSWLWNGHLLSNTIYFIRVRNDSAQAIDYDLFIK